MKKRNDQISDLKSSGLLTSFNGRRLPAFNGVRINHGRPYVTVAQQFLNCPNIVARLQQMARKTVAECMRGYAFA